MENDDAVAREGYVEETAVYEERLLGDCGTRENRPQRRGRWRMKEAGMAESFGGGEVI